MTTNDDTATILEVLVFKTDISTEEDLEKLSQILDRERRILKWNIDRADIDNVLRIESRNLDPAYITKVVGDAGFQCDELPD
jgi:hypothetical protein